MAFDERLKQAVMDYISLFLVCLLAISMFCRSKRIALGDFFEIRWKNQPVLFGAVIAIFCLFALDSFCHILGFFVPFDFIRENLDLIDCIIYFICSSLVSAAFLLINKIAIAKNDSLWMKYPIVWLIFAIIPLFLSVFFLKKAIFLIL